MPEQSSQLLVRWLRSLGRPAQGTDAELLSAYVASRDPSAFTELLRRHGPLVWGVCRRSVPSEQDAEDAFQATFLVLARKAAALRRGESLAGWLFRVALRTAALVRERSRPRDPVIEPQPIASPEAEAASAELCDAILDEVHRLPDRYRLPLLLCGLEGLTKAQAAQQLGWKEGTLSGRLARARQRLHERLVRRGIVSVAAAVLAPGSAVPAHLLAATARAAMRFANPGMSPAADSLSMTLALEVIRSMRRMTWKLFAPLALLGLLAVGTGLFAGLPASEPPRSEAPAGPPASRPAPPALPPQWQERLRLRGYAGHGYCVFSPDGRVLATVDGRHVLRFLDTTTWKERSRVELTKYPTGTNYPQLHPSSPDGKLFALWWKVPGKGEKGQPLIETWLIDVATGKTTAVLAGGEPQFSPAGKILATTLADTLVLWDWSSARELRRLEAGGRVQWRGDWFSPDGKRLFAPASSGRGKLWDPATGKEVATLEGYNPVWSRDGQALATVVPGPSVKLWDSTTGRLRGTLRGFSQPGCNVAFSPDGRLVLTSGSEWVLKPDGQLDLPQGGPFTPRRQRLEMRLWDAGTGKEVVRLPGEFHLCRSGVFSHDGKTVAYLRLTDAPDWTMELVLWDVAAGKERRVIQDEAGLDGVSFTTDGTGLIGTVGRSETGSMRLWDAATGRVRPFLPGEQGYLQFAPDGKTAVLAVTLPVDSADLPPEGIPTPMEVRVFQWTARTLTRETRGEPIEIKKKQPDPNPQR